MPDLFATTRKWLAQKRRAHLASPMTLIRGAAETPGVPVTYGMSGRYIESPDTGARVRVPGGDFLINTADYQFSGIRVLPAAGDRIRFQSPEGTVATYEITESGGDDCWRFADAYRETLRVHSKLLTDA